MEQRVKALESERELWTQKIKAMEQQLAQAKSGVIDTKLIQKPASFTGERSSWTDWAFSSRAYIGAVSPRMKLLMDHAQTSDIPLAPPGDEEDQKQNTQLYFIMVIVVKDQALRKVRMAPEGHGAWVASAVRGVRTSQGQEVPGHAVGHLAHDAEGASWAGAG